MVTRQWCWIWNEMSIDQHLPLQHAIDFCANWTAVFHLVYTPGSRFLHFWLHPNKSNHRLTESQIHTADWLNPSNKLPLNLFSFRTNSRKYDHIKQTYVCWCMFLIYLQTETIRLQSGNVYAVCILSRKSHIILWLCKSNLFKVFNLSNAIHFYIWEQ